MKNYSIKTALALLLVITITACSNNDNETITGTGALALEFDNAFKNNNLILISQTNTTASNEVLTISTAKYIVSNIVLTKEDGTIFAYPKSESYFIIDEATPASLITKLQNIPAGNYTKVTFGIGIDKAQWELGATGQGDFLGKAQAAKMMWSWTAGYKFLALEGTFTSNTITTPTPFMIHTGQTGTAYNYTQITLDLPTKALVRTNISPDIHIITDLSKIVDGQNTIKLSDNTMGGMGAMIMGGTMLESITTNVSKMFRVDHVHND